MDAADVKNHITDIESQIAWQEFHVNTLIRKIELLRQKVESQIVKPTRITHLSTITEKDVLVDLIPSVFASAETITARESFYSAMEELAFIKVSIAAKKEMLATYKAHLAQELSKQAKPCTDDMIYDKLIKAQSITDLSEKEETILNSIASELPARLSKSTTNRWELYETLQNFILQHGK